MRQRVRGRRERAGWIFLSLEAMSPGVAWPGLIMMSPLLLRGRERIGEREEKKERERGIREERDGMRQEVEGIRCRGEGRERWREKAQWWWL